MDKIKICFPVINNMGDLLNKYMLEDIFHITVTQTAMPKSNMSAIGSGLSYIFWPQNKIDCLRLLKQIPFQNTHFVWGTGFLNQSTIQFSNRSLFKHVIVKALRGKLTKAKLEDTLNTTFSVPLGDGGLLADRWVKKMETRYSIGLIPHYKEKDHPFVKQCKEYYGNDLIIIDVGKSPKGVVQQISQCDTILSSSLHGLIIADSYHIPNRHIMLYPYGQRVLGDGFKFKDYYSAFDLDDLPIIADDSKKIPKIQDIKIQYKVKMEEVERKKEQLITAFPYLTEFNRFSN